MSRVDQLYQQLSLAIIEQGYWYDDKSRGMRCKQLTSLTVDFDLQTEFPLLTTKKMHTKSIVGELIWFLRGLDNLEYLHENNITIWDKDAKNDFEGKLSDTHVGRNYGVQWRDWNKFVHDTWGRSNHEYNKIPVDQIKNLIEGLIENPMSRRHIVTAWNPAELHQTALPPCHWAFEILPRPIYEFEKELYPGKEYVFTLKWHQRSVDTFLGLPFNIASYGMLAKVIEELTGYVAIGLIGDLSNIHFYEGHIESAREQMKNNPLKHKGPQFKFSDKLLRDFELYRRGTIELDALFYSMKIEDFIFENYQSFEPIKAEMYEPINSPGDTISSSGDKTIT